ncbi:MAG TPA: PAS domain S-box protein [Anaerolineales bacterium]|nr:PAS domain S-box protein [Anaerolineales bacterium]
MSIIAVGLVGYFSFTLGRSNLERESFNKLTAVREMKAGQIEDYFKFIENQIITLSEDRMTIEALIAFDEGFHFIVDEIEYSDADNLELLNYYYDEFLPRLEQNYPLKAINILDYYQFQDEPETQILQHLYISSNPYSVGSKYFLSNPRDNSSYSQTHELYHPIFRDYLERFGYYDIFLINTSSGGHIIYTVFKEVDFGTSLNDGPYKDTNIAQVYRAALELEEQNSSVIVDFESYDPSYGAPAAFIASPIFDGGEKIGVLIFQLPIDKINAIMTNNQNWSAVGLGESGETYIVGNDFTLRNQSRFLIEDSENYFQMIANIGLPNTVVERIKNLNSSIKLQEVRTQGTEAALNSQTGIEIFPDYRGVSVLSAYRPLSIQGLNWVIMSEIDEAEAFRPIQQLASRTATAVIGLIAAIILVSLAFARTLTKPLQMLTGTANELANGNLDTYVDFTDQKDEIGTLASSFDVMRLSMKDLITDLEDINKNLEQKVEERTKELELSEQKTRSIVESASDGIIVLDQNSNILQWNLAAEKMFGYTSKEIANQPLHKLMPNRYQSQHDLSFKRANESGKLAKPGVTHEVAGVRKDGSEFPIELSLAHWKIGEESYFSGIVRDITERKEAEKALALANERVRTIVEIAPDAVITIDAQQNITLFNPRAEEIFGYFADEVIGQPLTMLMPEKSRDIHLGEIEKFSQEDMTARNMDNRREIMGQRKDGAIFPAEAGISKMLINDQQYFTTFFRDISERKEMERALEDANKRMTIELNFAREIQMGMVPLIFPAFPTRHEFSIFGKLIPAREVGGDFYDFYFLDEDHLCFVIGDVSGKGAAGALLMAVSKTLIKSRAMDDSQPSSILTHVNDELSRDNKTSMFVTIFLGVLNIHTGHIEYTNAGHNPPFIKRANGSIEKIDAFHGPVIGAMPNLTYKQDSGVLKKDDLIVLYTDGVTEAMNEKEELFTEEKYEKLIHNEDITTAQKLVDRTVVEVKRHEGEAEQADDITVLALQFSGVSDVEERGRLELKIKNQIDEMAVIEDKFEAFARKQGIPDEDRQKVSIVLDELMNNIISYAYQDEKEHIIEVQFVLTGNRLVTTIRDDGSPFNPFGLEPPEINLAIEERQIGGLGIHLVRSMMDEYMYHRQIGKNVVTLAKIISA